MKPENVIRAAAKLIEEGGHCQGCNVRDVLGREIPLFDAVRSDTGRAAIN